MSSRQGIDRDHKDASRRRLFSDQHYGNNMDNVVSGAYVVEFLNLKVTFDTINKIQLMVVGKIRAIIIERIDVPV